jgi:hypothetical protein
MPFGYEAADDVTTPSGQNMAGSHALASLVDLLELRGHVKACGREVIRGAVVLLGYRVDKSASNQPAP